MPNRSWLWLFVLASVVAFGFQGTRGLTDPDEGRYCEVAREMLTSGDFLHPHLDGFPHYTKPPLTYWSLAASMAVCGQNEWAARLFQSLSYLATILLVAASGSALFGAGVGVLAGIVYATMALPFVAANIITTDTLLTLWEALAVFAFIRGRSATGPSCSAPVARALWPRLRAGVLHERPAGAALLGSVADLHPVAGGTARSWRPAARWLWNSAALGRRTVVVPLSRSHDQGDHFVLLGRRSRGATGRGASPQLGSDGRREGLPAHSRAWYSALVGDLDSGLAPIAQAGTRTRWLLAGLAPSARSDARSCS